MTASDANPAVRRALALLGPLGPVRARAMFGGYGLFLDDAMVALIAWDTLYFKVDGETKARWREAGGRPFVYAGKGKPVEMSYWTAPPGVEDDPEALQPWAELALQAARRAAAAKAAKAAKRARR